MKLLSEDPTNYKDAPREGIRRIMQKVMTICQFLIFLTFFTQSQAQGTRTT